MDELSRTAQWRLTRQQILAPRFPFPERSRQALILHFSVKGGHGASALAGSRATIACAVIIRTTCRPDVTSLL